VISAESYIEGNITSYIAFERKTIPDESLDPLGKVYLANDWDLDRTRNGGGWTMLYPRDSAVYDRRILRLIAQDHTIRVDFFRMREGRPVLAPHRRTMGMVSALYDVLPTGSLGHTLCSLRAARYQHPSTDCCIL